MELPGLTFAEVERRQRARALQLRGFRIALDASIPDIERAEKLARGDAVFFLRCNCGHGATWHGGRGAAPELCASKCNFEGCTCAQYSRAMEYPDSAPCAIAPVPLEKQVEHHGDKLMRTYGFEPIRLSQPRPSKVTAGLPDRLYLNPTRRLAVWWEAKRPGGKQRLAQIRFEEIAVASGMDYVLGGVDALRQWLTVKLEARP